MKGTEEPDIVVGRRIKEEELRVREGRGAAVSRSRNPKKFK
jgi:hypothetical protein